jgi:hypothetical protein
VKISQNFEAFSEYMNFTNKKTDNTAKTLFILGRRPRYIVRDHPFKTSACLRGGGVKHLPNLPTDSTKKNANGRGVGVKNL